MPLRIGIVGTGLVGSAAVLALSRLPDVEVTAFEKAPRAREAGAWISLPSTGLLVLTKLVPPAEIDAIAYRPPDRAVYVTRHWRTGAVLLRRYSSDDLPADCVQARTHREPLLRLLLAHAPAGASIRYGQRVVGVHLVQGEGESEGVQLQLAPAEDATSGTASPTQTKEETFDLVVAADGLYSPTRRQFWPDHRVNFTGAVAYRAVFPVARVADIPGRHDDSSAWRKDGEVVFLSELGLGMYGIVVIRRETPAYVAAAGLRWEHPIGRAGVERLRALYGDWDPLLGRVLAAVDDLDAYPLDSGPWLRQLSVGARVVFVGDAAHPTAGAYGAGAAMGFGDCWALYRALEASRTVSSDGRAAGGAIHGHDGGRAAPHAYDLAKAVRIYEQTRLPFLRRVEQQRALDAKDAQYIAAAAGDETEWIRRFTACNPPNTWLTEHDVEQEVQTTVVGGWGRLEPAV